MAICLRYKPSQFCNNGVLQHPFYWVLADNWLPYVLYPALLWNRTKHLESIATCTLKNLNGIFNFFIPLIRQQIGATADLVAIWEKWWFLDVLTIQILGKFVLHLLHTYVLKNNDNKENNVKTFALNSHLKCSEWY